MCKTINESLDSKEQVRAVFLRLDVNVLVFYRFPKSFNPVASPDRQSCVDICSSVSRMLRLSSLGTPSSSRQWNLFSHIQDGSTSPSWRGVAARAKAGSVNLARAFALFASGTVANFSFGKMQI